MNKLYESSDNLKKITLRISEENAEWLKSHGGFKTVRDLVEKYLYKEEKTRYGRLLKRPNGRPLKYINLETRLNNVSEIFINDPYVLKVEVAAAKNEGPIANGLFAYVNFEGIYRGNKKYRIRSGTICISSVCNNENEKPVLTFEKPENVIIQTETFNGKPWQIKIAIWNESGTILYTETIKKEKNKEEMND